MNSNLVTYQTAKECMNNCTFGERNSIISVIIRQNENVGRDLINIERLRNEICESEYNRKI